MLSRRPGAGARGARRRGGRAGSPSTSPRPSPRSRAATASSTSPARTSPSAGTTTPSGGCSRRASWARATSSPACAAADPRPASLVSASAVGYYGPHGDEPVDRGRRRPGDDFLAADLRRVGARGGRGGGARRARRARCAPASCSTRAAARWPRCSRSSSSASAGRSRAAASTCPGSTSTTSSGSTSPRSTAAAWSGPVNATAPDARRPTRRSRRRSAARCTGPRSRRCPGFAVRMLYGEMADIVVHGQRAVPERALALGFRVPRIRTSDALRCATRWPADRCWRKLVSAGTGTWAHGTPVSVRP